MAIKKKGNTGFLNGTTVEKLDNIVQQQSEAPVASTEPETVQPAEEAAETAEKPQANDPVEPQASPEATPEARKPLTLEDVMGSEDLIKQVAQQIIKQGGAKGIEGLEHPKQGRPRKELIKGIDEVSVNLQLPETLVKALRKKAKDEKKTIKELIGYAVMNAYPELTK